MYHRKSLKGVKNLKTFVIKPVEIEEDFSKEIEVLLEKKVTRREVENELVRLIAEFVKKEGLTISNVREVVEKVIMYMEDNATLNE